MAQFSFLEMAPRGHTCAQTVQPTHWFGSMWAFLSRMVTAGQATFSSFFCSRCTFRIHYTLADIMLDPLDEQAGTAGDDRCGHVAGEGVLHGLFHGRKILRVDDVNILVAVGREDILDPEGLGDVALEVAAAAGVLLMACHAGDGVVEHDGE